MAVKTVVAESSVRIGQLEDMFRQFKDGSLTGEHVQAFLEHRNPFASPVWERNENGHIGLSIVGLDQAGEAEVESLRRQKYNVGPWAESCFKSTNDDGYDSVHRLVPGQNYQIVLVPGKEIKNCANRTTKDLLALGERYGYIRPQAGIIPRLRERLTDKQLEELGWLYVVALHQSIVDKGGHPDVLGLYRDGNGRRVHADRNSPADQWDGGGAFAFLVPADHTSLVV